MDKLLKNISKIDDYCELTHNISAKENVSVIFNLSTVLAIKKVQVLEIEYFNKYESNGVALYVFDDLLKVPPSKTWGVLGKELILLIKYWLEAVRKKLLNLSLNWWIFLKTLLRFIKILREKHNSFPNFLVEETAECLLDLAANAKVDMQQKYEIVSCFNLYTSKSSREVRLHMRHKLENYLSRLSILMASCGHFPTQLSVLEALLRWTQNRHDATVRKRMVEQWFPSDLYCKGAVTLFIERKWSDFIQDARDFLNYQNNSTALVTSVICKRLAIGKIIIVSGLENRNVWLDINSSTKCMSLLLDPEYLKPFVPNPDCFETLTIPADKASAVQLLIKPAETVLTVTLTEPLELNPSTVKIRSNSDADVIITVANQDVEKMKMAVRGVFGDAKFKSQEIIHPAVVQTQRRAGYMVKSVFDPLRSPSSVSTSSLAQLHDKLAALPRCRYDKEPVKICSTPELSKVSEVTEPTERSSLDSTTSTFKLQPKPWSVFGKTFKNVLEDRERKSQSDSELNKLDKNKRHRISPVLHDENSISLLLCATVGSDNSIINDTLERLPKENIVDLLVKEALQAKQCKDKQIDSDGNGINSDFVENTPQPEVNVNRTSLKTVDVGDQKSKSKEKSSSSNESNTEDLNCPVSFVSTRKKRPRLTSEEREQVFNAQTVENFYAQHLCENSASEIVISPTLARKINDSSSDLSDEFDVDVFNDNNLNASKLLCEEVQMPVYNENDVLNCLSALIDKVCDDLDKCKEYLRDDKCKPPIQKNISKETDHTTKSQNEGNLRESDDEKQKPAKKKQVPKKKGIKLKYIIAPKSERNKKSKAKNKLELASQANMTTINEVEEDIVEKAPSPVPPSPQKNKKDASSSATNGPTDSDTPLIRRKRKLYSPKQDDTEMRTEIKKPKVIIPETCEEIVPPTNRTDKHTSKATATPYKDLEKERKLIRKTRNRKPTGKTVIPLSPKTLKKNEVFDMLKEKIESNENIVYADKNAEIYNFTSDSEDEDFKKKKVDLKKHTSLTSVDSNRTKRGRKKRVDYTEKKSDSTNEDTTVQKPRQKRLKRQNTRSKKTTIAKTINKELVDERMREAPIDVLDSSLIVEYPVKVIQEKDPEPILEDAPEMEIITDKETKNEDVVTPQKINKRSKQTKHILSIKKEKAVQMNIHDKKISDESSVISLPDLVVESAPETNKIDADESITQNMVNKFKKIYKEGPVANDISNTTQNMLSDVERVNRSLDLNEDLVEDPLDVVIIDEFNNFNQSDSNKENIPLSRKRKLKLSKPEMRENKRSIDTVGSSPITAHGDCNESPPRPELLNETVVPRNLEIEDLDQSIANYFLQLTQQANESGENVYSRDEPKLKSSKDASAEDTKDTRSSNKSLVISVTRLSSGEIHRWLPSPRSSDSEDEDHNKPTKKQLDVSDVTVKARSKDNASDDDDTKDTQSSNCILVASVKKLPRTEKQRWVTSPRKSDSEDEEFDKEPIELQKTKSLRQKHTVRNVTKKNNPKQTSSDEDDSTVVSVKTTKRVTRSTIQNKSTTIADEPEASKNIVHSQTKRNAQKPQHSSPKIACPSPPIKQSKIPRKSVISPINLNFDDGPSTDICSNKSVSTEKLTSKHRTNSKASISQKSLTSKPTKNYNLRHSPKRQRTRQLYSPRARRNIPSPVSIDTPVVEIGDSEKSVQHLEVRNSTVSDDGNEEIRQSGASVPSVHEWFRSIAKTSREENESSCNKELIATVLEKLDTTLAEIHQSTNKRLVSVFVNAQKRLQRQREERFNLYRDLENKILDMERKYMEDLKRESCETLKEDNKQKRAMVRLLKEDIQAVVDYLERNKRTRHS